MLVVKIAWQSILDRKATALLTILSIVISVSVLLVVEHIRHEARSSFNKTVSGVDLIVGARGGQLNLLLYSVFRMGDATSDMSWKSYQAIAANPEVEWTIPISLGDSHRGHRVLGTNEDYFQHFRYGQGRALTFREGERFQDMYDAVLGFQVAKALAYQLGDEIILSHGLVSTPFTAHADTPFRVVGILAPTGTPVDQTIHVSLAGIEAIHHSVAPVFSAAPPPGTAADSAAHTSATNTATVEPISITAFLVGLKSKIATFSVQRTVNEYPNEALRAILPGVALSELWQMLATVEKVLLLISVLVLLASLLGMSSALLTAMRERRRELAILRSVGASPVFILLLIQLEIFITLGLGVLSSIVMVSLALVGSKSFLMENYGLFVGSNLITGNIVIVLASIFLLGMVVGLIPAVSAYRSSLDSRLYSGN